MKPRLVSSHHSIYIKEDNCFPVSKRTENKPDLPLWGKETKVRDQNKCRVGRGVDGLCKNEDIDMNSEIFRKCGWIKGYGPIKNAAGGELGV